MSSRLMSSSFAAGIAMTVMFAAQAPAQQTAPPPSQAPTPTQQPTQQPMPGAEKSAASDQAFTITGCVLKEANVLKKGAVGAAAESAGMGNEFVLAQAKVNDSGAGAATEKPESDTAVGTSGSSGFGRVFRLTGDKENDLKNYVGQKVEVHGMFKNASDATASAPTGDLTEDNTPEITITSVAPASGSCSVSAIK
jgi:hypothetical protein